LFYLYARFGFFVDKLKHKLLILATAYGIGSYFSSDFNYSRDYSMQGRCGSPPYSIILAQVVTGRFTVGNSNTDRKNLPEQYHSTVNNIENPTIFVVYHDAAAYPQYIIKFR